MLPYLLLSLNLLTFRPAPIGTRLHVRLTNSVGSYASKAGMPIGAVVIAPVAVNGETLLPAGSTLSGSVNWVHRVGLGVRHETAAISLEFSEVSLPDGQSFPLDARLVQVDNSRERVTDDGAIRGVRATNSLSYRVSGYVRTALSWEVESQVALWAIKTLVVQVPEPEIYFPAGAELTLALTGPLLSNTHTRFKPVARPLTEDERAGLETLMAEIPYRAYARSPNRPSDLVNMVFIGSREQVSSAFTAAGWTETSAPSLRSRIGWIRAVAEGRGYKTAYMSPLLLNDIEADMSWQKGLNDVAKRHHVRMWRQSATWDGEEVWIGAATRDVDYAYLRPGQPFTHRIQEDVDQERDKIAHDLEFTACADVVDWWERPGVTRVSHNATGDPMNTDARLAVIRLNDCHLPRLSTETSEANPVRARGNKFHRFVRREILSARSDLLRNNLYWRGYEGARWIVTAIRQHRHQTADPDRIPTARAAGLERSSVSWSPFSRDRLGWLW